MLTELKELNKHFKLFNNSINITKYYNEKCKKFMEIVHISTNIYLKNINKCYIISLMKLKENKYCLEIGTEEIDKPLYMNGCVKDMEEVVMNINNFIKEIDK